MSAVGKNVFDELKKRGLIDHCSDLKGLAAKEKITAYLGIDCTADSLHVGHLLPLTVALHLVKAGHKIIVLLGGATTLIGDPSGKDKTRPRLTKEEIAANCESITAFLKDFFKRNASEGYVIFENNIRWFGDIKYIDFLRDYGKYFSVNEMLTLTSVKERLERQQPMNFVEFNYVLLQSYDFYRLNEDYGCVLQIGGSDQWGNMAHGISLGKRFNKELYGLTVPLLTTSDGRKMGKTEGGAVWLSGNKLSAFDYWQFFRNIEDASVEKCWYYFTFDDLPEERDINEVKKRLATEATTICRGAKDAEAAAEQAGMMFGSRVDEDIGAEWPDLDGLNENEICEKLSECCKFKYDPILSVCHDKMLFCRGDRVAGESSEGGIFLSSVIHELGFAKSLGNAKDLLRGRAVKLNDKVIDDVIYALCPGDFKRGNRATISVGKKQQGVLLSDCQKFPTQNVPGEKETASPNGLPGGTTIADLMYNIKYFATRMKDSNIQLFYESVLHLCGYDECLLPTNDYVKSHNLSTPVDIGIYTAKININKLKIESSGKNVTYYVEKILEYLRNITKDLIYKCDGQLDLRLINPGHIYQADDKLIIEISVLIRPLVRASDNINENEGVVVVSYDKMDIEEAEKNICGIPDKECAKDMGEICSRDYIDVESAECYKLKYDKKLSVPCVKSLFYESRLWDGRMFLSNVLHKLEFAESLGHAKDLIRKGVVMLNDKIVPDMLRVLGRNFGNRATISAGERCAALFSNVPLGITCDVEGEEWVRKENVYSLTPILGVINKIDGEASELANSCREKGYDKFCLPLPNADNEINVGIYTVRANIDREIDRESGQYADALNVEKILRCQRRNAIEFMRRCDKNQYDVRLVNQGHVYGVCDNSKLVIEMSVLVRPKQSDHQSRK